MLWNKIEQSQIATGNFMVVNILYTLQDNTLFNGSFPLYVYTCDHQYQNPLLPPENINYPPDSLSISPVLP